jgi:hypothetical protein
MRKWVAVAALVSAMIALTPSAGNAPTSGPPPLPTTHPPNPCVVGACIVGGIGLSALSVIVRAMVISNREHRELTSAEAITATIFPFIWVFFDGGPSYIAVPVPTPDTHAPGHKGTRKLGVPVPPPTIE